MEEIKEEIKEEMKEEMKDCEIEIQRITQENIRACAKLQVAEEQREFVAPNLATIAWAYVDPCFTPYAICAGETVVGLAAVEYIPDNDLEDKHWIPRFMIGEGYQGKGYGKKAMYKLIEIISKHEDCERIRLSVVPENQGAIAFYQRLGFTMTGEKLEGEQVMELCL